MPLLSNTRQRILMRRSPERDCAHGNLRDFEDSQRAKPAGDHAFERSQCAVVVPANAHGIISLLADDDVPDITVGIGWNEGTTNDTGASSGKGDWQSWPPRSPWSWKTSHPCDVRGRCGCAGGGGRHPGIIHRVPIRIGTKVIGTLTIDRIWDGRSYFGWIPMSAS